MSRLQRNHRTFLRNSRSASRTLSLARQGGLQNHPRIMGERPWLGFEPAPYWIGCVVPAVSKVQGEFGQVFQASVHRGRGITRRLGYRFHSTGYRNISREHPIVRKYCSQWTPAWRDSTYTQWRDKFSFIHRNSKGVFAPPGFAKPSPRRRITLPLLNRSGRS
jgi:hypothetical protein